MTGKNRGGAAEEIGGYIEFEKNDGPMLHEEALALNSARNALAYLIRAKGIRRIALPNFLCDSVTRLCIACQTDVVFYEVDSSLLPVNGCVDFAGGGGYTWLYLVNYYGQLTNGQICSYRAKHPRLIVDNVQAYYDAPVPGVDTIYSCRKFFGVPDGAFLYTDMQLPEALAQDLSFGRMAHIMGRFDTCASEHYELFTQNERNLESVPLLRMSRLTENLLRGIDYDRVKAKRTENYAYLAARLNGINRLTLHQTSGAFAYPLWLRNGAAVRQRLIAEKIYVPTLWPNVFNEQPESSLAYDLAANLLPLPCDQRYGEVEMRFICEQVMKAVKELDC